MRRIILVVLTLVGGFSDAALLSEKYLIEYGCPSAPIHIVHYFNFSCPHCQQVFSEEFSKIKANWIDTGKVRVTMHPIPDMDLTTVVAMHCLSQLSEENKRIFFEESFPRIPTGNEELAVFLLANAIDSFPGTSSDKIKNIHLLEESSAYKDTLSFVLSGSGGLSEIPSIEVNGKLLPSGEMTEGYLQGLIEFQGEGSCE